MVNALAYHSGDVVSSLHLVTFFFFFFLRVYLSPLSLILLHIPSFLARLYESTRRAIAVTPVGVAQMLKFLVKGFICLQHIF